MSRPTGTIRWSISDDDPYAIFAPAIRDRFKKIDDLMIKLGEASK